MKKIICAAIAAIMALSCCLVFAFADDTEPADVASAIDVDVPEYTIKDADYYTDYDYNAWFDENGYFKDVRASDYVDLVGVDPFYVPDEEMVVTDDEIQEQIDALLERFTTKEQITSRAVADGDTLNIDYVGTIDGEEFSGGSASNYEVTIGVTSFVDGFLDQVVGHKPGETFDVFVTFPEDYKDEAVAGKDAVFSVTVNYIVGDDVVPELNDEFVSGKFAEQYDLKTVDELRAYIHDGLRKQRVSAYVQQHIVDDSTFSAVPEQVYTYVVDSLIANYYYYAKAYGMDVEEFISGQLGSTLEDEVAKNVESNINQAKFLLAVQAAAEKLSAVKLDEAALEKYFTDNFSTSDYQQYLDQYGEGYVKMIVLQELVMNHIIDNAKPASERTSPALIIAIIAGAAVLLIGGVVFMVLRNRGKSKKVPAPVCPECGAKLVPDAQFCEMCGAEVNLPEEESAEEAVEESTEKVAEATEEVTEATEEVAEEAADEVAETAEETVDAPVEEAVEEAAEEAAETAEEAVEEAAEEAVDESSEETEE